MRRRRGRGKSPQLPPSLGSTVPFPLPVLPRAQNGHPTFSKEKINCFFWLWGKAWICPAGAMVTDTFRDQESKQGLGNLRFKGNYIWNNTGLTSVTVSLPSSSLAPAPAGNAAPTFQALLEGLNTFLLPCQARPASHTLQPVGGVRRAPRCPQQLPGMSAGGWIRDLWSRAFPAAAAAAFPVFPADAEPHIHRAGRLVPLK